MEEVINTFAVHKEMGSLCMGLHFELTGDDVTECVGGVQDLTAEDLARRYTTYCDPRLNSNQSLEMAFRTCELIENSTENDKKMAN